MIARPPQRLFDDWLLVLVALISLSVGAIGGIAVVVSRRWDSASNDAAAAPGVELRHAIAMPAGIDDVRPDALQALAEKSGEKETGSAGAAAAIATQPPGPSA
jgi:hypothetical protein